MKNSFNLFAAIAATATLPLAPTLAGNLTVNGNLTVETNATVEGQARIGGTAYLNTAFVNGNLDVKSNAFLEGDANVDFGLSVGGPADLYGDLRVMPWVVNAWHGTRSTVEVGALGKTNAIYGELGPDASNIVDGVAVEGYCTGPDTSGVFGELGHGDAEPGGEFPIRDYYGVYGHADASDGNAYAGYFDGRVNMNGVLSAQANVGIGTGSPGAQLDVEGSDDSGSWAAPIALIQNNDKGNAAAPALRLAGWGNTTYGVLSVSANGPGLIAQFGNYSKFVADIKNDGTIDAKAFNTTSDRNAKENFSPISPAEVLHRVVSLPISRWNFKQDDGVSHVGPMAQDFHAAFNVGSDDKHIATVDEEGVALAAIQGLNQKLNEKDAEIRDLKARLTRLEQLIETRNSSRN